MVKMGHIHDILDLLKLDNEHIKSHLRLLNIHI